jgi:hypothetical protein
MSLQVFAGTPPRDLNTRAYTRSTAALRTRVVMIFDDAGNPPLLDFHVELEGGGAQVFSERVTSPTSAALVAEERGAAAGTAIKAGLIRRRGAA